MTPEERSLLERTYKLSEETRDILKSMRRTARISAFVRITYWVIIIGVSIGAYYLIQPYVQSLTSLFSSDTFNSSEAQSAAETLKLLIQ